MHERRHDVSTKDLIRVRRLAARRRAASACARCKRSKIRCSDNRPCKKCSNSNLECFEASKGGQHTQHIASSDISGDLHFPAQSFLEPDTFASLLRENQQDTSIGDRIESNANKSFSSQTCSLCLNPHETESTCGTKSYQLERQPVQACYARPTRLILTDVHKAINQNAIGSKQGTESPTPALDSAINYCKIPALAIGPGTTLFLPAMRIPSSPFNSSTCLQSCVPAMRNPPSSSTFLPPTTAVLLHCSSDLQPPFSNALLPPPRFLRPVLPQPFALLQNLHSPFSSSRP
jgi:hypothetical protein